MQIRGLIEPRFVRFALVGGFVALVYIGCYVALMRLGLYQPLANGLAFAICVAVQYVGQTLYTFRQNLAVPTQIVRFLIMICCGLVVSALITGGLAPAIGLTDWVAAVVVSVVLPVQNYIFLKLWVYTGLEAASEGGECPAP